jgi:hypothetical protein
MDDGTRIQLEVRIDRELGTAEFDWTGTGHQTLGNVSIVTHHELIEQMNSPISLSYAAIIYTLRSMIARMYNPSAELTSSRYPNAIKPRRFGPNHKYRPRGLVLEPLWYGRHFRFDYLEPASSGRYSTCIRGGCLFSGLCFVDWFWLWWTRRAWKHCTRIHLRRVFRRRQWSWTNMAWQERDLCCKSIHNLSFVR